MAISQRLSTGETSQVDLADIRLTGGTPLLLIDLVGVNASLGFTPNYNTKRDAVLDTAELELMQRAGLEARRQADPSKAANLQGLLYLWCQLTHGRGKGCSGSGTGNTFARVPILGNLFEADYIPRR
jgi:hypothetical protein